MVSRRAHLLLTRVMQQCLNALLPSEMMFHGDARDSGAQSGVFLESDRSIYVDSYWWEWEGEERKRIHRRVIVDVTVEEREIESTP